MKNNEKYTLDFSKRFEESKAIIITGWRNTGAISSLCV